VARVSACASTRSASFIIIFPRSVEAISRQEGCLKAARAAATAISTECKGQIGVFLGELESRGNQYHLRRRQRRQRQSLSRHCEEKILNARSAQVTRGHTWD